MESGKVGPLNQVNYSSRLSVVTPSDHAQSVQNRCVIEPFVGGFVFNVFAVRDLCHWSGSDLFPFSYFNRQIA